MRRLREQVEAPDALNDILLPAHLRLALAEDHAAVTRLRVHVAADVYDGAAPKRDELVDEAFVGALARRIDDERRVRVRECLHGVENVRRVALEERDLVRGYAIERRVHTRGAYACRVELDAAHDVEVRREHDREEPAAAVRVDEVRRARVRARGREDRVSYVRREWHEHRVVVLEERAGGVLEEHVADALADPALVVRHADLLLRPVCRRELW